MATCGTSGMSNSRNDTRMTPTIASLMPRSYPLPSGRQPARLDPEPIVRQPDFSHAPHRRWVAVERVVADLEHITPGRALFDRVEQPFYCIQRPWLAWRPHRLAARVAQRDGDAAPHFENRRVGRPGTETSHRDLDAIGIDVSRPPRLAVHVELTQ